MALYFYFNETTGDLVYSDKATYGVSGYVSLGQQTEMYPSLASDWVFNSKRSAIVTVSKDKRTVEKIDGLTNMNFMFSTCSSLTSIDLSGFDTSFVSSMNGMFYSCSKLTSLNLSGFDTSSVTNMKNMFANCTSLTSLDLSSFDTSAVTDMSSMFNFCNKLTSLDLSGFDTSSVTNMSGMFSGFWIRIITINNKMSNVLSLLPANQYYPAAGGSPVAKANLTAGTWVGREADLSKVTSIVQQAQMSQAISRRIGGVRRDIVSMGSELKGYVDGLMPAGTFHVETGQVLLSSGAVNSEGSVEITLNQKIPLPEGCHRSNGVIILDGMVFLSPASVTPIVASSYVGISGADDVRGAIQIYNPSTQNISYVRLNVLYTFIWFA